MKKHPRFEIRPEESPHDAYVRWLEEVIMPRIMFTDADDYQQTFNTFMEHEEAVIRCVQATGFTFAQIAGLFRKSSAVWAENAIDTLCSDEVQRDLIEVLSWSQSYGEPFFTPNNLSHMLNANGSKLAPVLKDLIARKHVLESIVDEGVFSPTQLSGMLGDSVGHLGANIDHIMKERHRLYALIRLPERNEADNRDKGRYFEVSNVSCMFNQHAGDMAARLKVLESSLGLVGALVTQVNSSVISSRISETSTKDIRGVLKAMTRELRVNTHIPPESTMQIAAETPVRGHGLST